MTSRIDTAIIAIADRLYRFSGVTVAGDVIKEAK